MPALFPVDTRRHFNLYKTSIRRRRRGIDVLKTLKRRRVCTGLGPYYALFRSVESTRIFSVRKNTTTAFSLTIKQLKHAHIQCEYANSISRSLHFILMVI